MSTLSKDKTLLITGGTGSFGNAVLQRFLHSDFGETSVFSRDVTDPAMVSREEMARGKDLGGHYRIPADSRDLNYEKYFVQGEPGISEIDDYTFKVMTVVGTRPEIIRLSRTIDKLDRHCEHVLVHTGQNDDYELNEVFFGELGIRASDHLSYTDFLNRKVWHKADTP